MQVIIYTFICFCRLQAVQTYVNVFFLLLFSPFHLRLGYYIRHMFWQIQKSREL